MLSFVQRLTLVVGGMLSFVQLLTLVVGGMLSFVQRLTLVVGGMLSFVQRLTLVVGGMLSFVVLPMTRVAINKIITNFTHIIIIIIPNIYGALLILFSMFKGTLHN